MLIGTHARRNRAKVVFAIISLSAAHNVLLLALPIYSLQVMSRVLPTGDISTLCSITALLFMAITADWAVERSRGAAIARLASEAILDLQHEVSRRSNHLDDDTKLFEQACVLKARLAGPLGLAVLDAPWASIFLLALFYLKVELGFAALVILSGIFAAGAFSSLAQKSRVTLAQVNRGCLEGSLHADRGSRPNVSECMHNRFAEAAGHALRAADEDYERLRTTIGISQAVRIFGQAGLIAATAMLVARDEIAVGSILAASMLFARVIAPVDKCSDVVLMTESVRLLLDVLQRRKQMIAAPVRVRPLLPQLTGCIDVGGVSVYHPAGRSYVLKDVSCTLVPGRLTVLAGQSGSGKSILMDLIAGRARPDTGHIRIDGFVLSDISHDKRDRLIGYLKSRPTLVRGSFAQIIAGEKAVFLRSVMEAAALAGINRYIENLPDAYGTILSLDDPSLSRGQQQQLWLARSFYGNPKILMLDEPTVFLDEESTLSLVSALKLLLQNGTNVIVASRNPEILALHDQVICLAPGRFVGSLSRKEIDDYARQ